MTASDAKKTTSAGGKTAAKKDFDKSASKPANSNKPSKPTEAGRVHEFDKKHNKLTATRFIITSAQNNTPVHEGFFRALENYARHNGAQLIVNRFTYNKSAFNNKKTVKDGAHDSFQSYTKEDVDRLSYDKKIMPYVLDQRCDLAKGLELGGEINIIPTRKKALSTYKSYFKMSSGIVPHATQNMESLGGTKEDGARFLYATGACTKRNYIQKSAGQEAEARHIYGALVVERDDDGKWFVRQIMADNNGAFYDLDKKYMPNGKILEDQRPESITWGDIHVEKMDPQVYKSAFGKGGMLDALKPKYQFMHDLPDFEARSHHNINSDFHWVAQAVKKTPTVERLMEICAEFLRAAERPDTQTKIVEGNHDRHFLKWLGDDKNIKRDYVNMPYFYRAKAQAMQFILDGGTEGKIFEWAVRDAALRKKITLRSTTFLTPGTNFRTCKGSIENNFHGDIGKSGLRGNADGFIEGGPKFIIGHSHSARIVQGVFQVGTSSLLDMGYNALGLNSWSHTHAVTYPNGKRTLVTMQNGKWRATNKVDPSQTNVPPLKPHVHRTRPQGPAAKAA